MEYTQWELLERLEQVEKFCLNPCCNGIYSMSLAIIPTIAAIVVLILVVMEYTQWDE